MQTLVPGTSGSGSGTQGWPRANKKVMCLGNGNKEGDDPKVFGVIRPELSRLFSFSEPGSDNFS